MEQFAFLNSMETQAAEKLTSDFHRNIKDRYGAKITDNQMRMFARSIPNLLQSKEGRRQVIKNLLTLNGMEETYFKAQRSIIKENNGVPPLDLHALALERSDNDVAKLSDQFGRNLELSKGSIIPASQLNDLIGSPVYMIRSKKDGQLYNYNSRTGEKTPVRGSTSKSFFEKAISSNPLLS